MTRTGPTVPDALLLGLIAGVAIFVLACSSAKRDDSGQIIEGGDLDVFTMQIGDCFQAAVAEAVADVSALPCSQPHDNEVYFLFKLDGSGYPGREEVALAAVEPCLSAFESYVGATYDQSRLEIDLITPTERSWNDFNDREIVCFLYEEDRRITGSMKDSGQ